jgi:hypothetical protein
MLAHAGMPANGTASPAGEDVRTVPYDHIHTPTFAYGIVCHRRMHKVSFYRNLPYDWIFAARVNTWYTVYKPYLLWCPIYADHKPYKVFYTVYTFLWLGNITTCRAAHGFACAIVRGQ